MWQWGIHIRDSELYTSDKESEYENIFQWVSTQSINYVRHLAAIYEVLKDKERRARYDQVLVEGLPDWRMPVYYFRRMRKIGLAEGLAYLLGKETSDQHI